MALQGTEFCNHELKKIIYTMKIVFDTYHNKVIQTVKLLWNYVYCEKHYKNKPWLDLTWLQGNTLVETAQVSARWNKAHEPG